jgi:hypothetical protein
MAYQNTIRFVAFNEDVPRCPDPPDGTAPPPDNETISTRLVHSAIERLDLWCNAPSSALPGLARRERTLHRAALNGRFTALEHTDHNKACLRKGELDREGAQRALRPRALAPELVAFRPSGSLRRLSAAGLHPLRPLAPGAHPIFARRGMPVGAYTCRRARQGPASKPWSDAGITRLRAAR